MSPADDKEPRPAAMAEAPAAASADGTAAAAASGPAPTTPPPPPAPMTLGLRSCYMFASTILAIARGLGLSLVSSNIQQLEGGLGATQVETTWLVAAYLFPQASLTILLVKLRTQFGLRRFCEISIAIFVVSCMLSFLALDLRSALLVRFLWGVAAAPISTLAVFYMFECFEGPKKLTVGLPLALTNLSIATPVARLISPTLMESGGWHALTAFELGLAVIGLGLVYRLPLTPMPRANVIHWRDLVSYALVATGLGTLATVFTMGRFYWWFDAPWIGWALALAVAALTVAVVLELNRPSPLLDIRWLLSPQIVHFAGALLMFRVVLSEQSSGAPGMFLTLGLQNEQMRTLYLVILLATMMGGFLCAGFMTMKNGPQIHVIALLLLIGGAFIDSHSTSLTRPNDMLLSQGMIALATGLFLPPAMAQGFGAAIAKGPVYILSFIAMFLSTQIVGGALGGAVFGTLVQTRTAYHTQILQAALPASDPLVTARVSQYAAAYAGAVPSAGSRQAIGLSSLNTVVNREATVLAYNDLFFGIAVLATVALAALLIHMAILTLLDRRAAAMAAAAAPRSGTAA